MKKNILATLFACLLMPLFAQERIEMIPFGDFNQWVTRHIEESRIIGGKTRTIHALGTPRVINENTPYPYGADGCPWSSSNVWAHVAGIHKATATTYPEKRGDGYCCRMNVELVKVVVMGFINIEVMVAGTMFTGKTIEPIRTQNDPYQNIDFGIPFTKKPSAMLFDYKAIVRPDSIVTIAKGFGKPKDMKGWDAPQVYMYLQKRWEDKDGNIYAHRVGTAWVRFDESQQEWHNDYRLPVHYGDITKEAFYNEDMGLGHTMRALNSKDDVVPIQEVGWGAPTDTPTHVIIMLTSGHKEAFVAREGNALWIDNMRLVYPQE